MWSGYSKNCKFILVFIEGMCGKKQAVRCVNLFGNTYELLQQGPYSGLQISFGAGGKKLRRLIGAGAPAQSFGRTRARRQMPVVSSVRSKKKGSSPKAPSSSRNTRRLRISCGSSVARAALSRCSPVAAPRCPLLLHARSRRRDSRHPLTGRSPGLHPRRRSPVEAFKKAGCSKRIGLIQQEIENNKNLQLLN